MILCFIYGQFWVLRNRCQKCFVLTQQRSAPFPMQHLFVSEPSNSSFKICQAFSTEINAQERSGEAGDRKNVEV